MTKTSTFRQSTKHIKSKSSLQDNLSKIILTKLSEIELLLQKSNDHALRQTSKPLTFREACAYLGYAPSYLYKLTYKNIIPHYKPTGKIIFFSKNELDEWIFSSAERRVQNEESKSEDVSASPDKKDPNQIEMDLSEEVLIEFPLKSRRRLEL